MSSIATGSVAMHRPRARTSSRGSDFALRNCSAGSIGGAATGIRWPLRMSLAVYLQRRNSRQLQLTCASGRRASRQDFNHGVRRGRLLRAKVVAGPVEILNLGDDRRWEPHPKLRFAQNPSRLRDPPVRCRCRCGRHTGTVTSPLPGYHLKKQAGLAARRSLVGEAA